MEAAELKNKANRNGKRTAPCDTPDEVVKWSEEMESTVTY
jgi:hypothetical protein